MIATVSKRSGSGRQHALGRFSCWAILYSLLVLLGVTTEAARAGPLSERLIIVAERKGLNKMYICRSDGRDLRRFSQEPGHQIQPHYSPALQRVFYVRLDERRREQICSVDLKGEDFRLELDTRGSVRYPNVSPDGKTLLFSSDRWGALELAEMDLSTREIKRLTYDQGVNTHAKYSPDGTQILFLSRRNGISQVYLTDRKAQNFHLVTETLFQKGAPSWNSTGTRIVATEALPPKLRSVLFEIELETKRKRFLLPRTRDVSDASYSADGTQVLFIEEDTLYTFDPADTTAHPFPIQGNLFPKDAIWVEFPLP